MIEAMPEEKRTDEVAKPLSEEKSLGEACAKPASKLEASREIVYAVLH